jgi:hypothetical protein
MSARLLREHANLFLVFGGEERNLSVGNVGPMQKLLAPLHHRNTE